MLFSFPLIFTTLVFPSSLLLFLILFYSIFIPRFTLCVMCVIFYIVFLILISFMCYVLYCFVVNIMFVVFIVVDQLFFHCRLFKRFSTISISICFIFKITLVVSYMDNIPICFTFTFFFALHIVHMRFSMLAFYFLVLMCVACKLCLVFVLLCLKPCSSNVSMF